MTAYKLTVDFTEDGTAPATVVDNIISAIVHTLSTGPTTVHGWSQAGRRCHADLDFHAYHTGDAELVRTVVTSAIAPLVQSVDDWQVRALA